MWPEAWDEVTEGLILRTTDTQDDGSLWVEEDPKPSVKS